MTAHRPATHPTVAEQVAAWLVATTPEEIPIDVVEVARRLFVDVAGLCIAARHEPYVTATLAAVDRGGACTALGHHGGERLRPRRAEDGEGGFDVFGAALINGTAAHGEDYDDTFEGGPVHSGAVVVPAVLAICEREGLGGDRLLVGIATGAELLCRLSLVAPTATHKAGFHPTAVFGTLAAAGAVGSALRLPPSALASALGIAGSMASGIIEYLAEGTWTKRMHAGWAAQSGVRAALMARGGFVGPRTVFEGVHGVYRAFAPSVNPDFEHLLDGLGSRWTMRTIAFKPYACGTMTQPFIDCAIRLADAGIRSADIASMLCEVGEGTVHRLWEPLAAKHRPPTPYAAKFSTPFCMALGFLERSAGLAQFTETRLHDPEVLELAAKIRYQINPKDEYPRKFSGHLRAALVDGTEREFRQPHLRGGEQEPLSGAELEKKFLNNAIHGGWSPALAER
ncbi:MAG TPA: MmgE/PrpD family protein, partial [Vicinamibacterales bacterium]|nr:MmgE/PrpD family protein [Vicinamibacterales bacterium]